MEYRKLGRTGALVSPLCLGTMNFGPQVDEAGSFAVMDLALELGLNFFDTADVYGFKLGEGITESIIGRWLAQGGGRRERIVLATKAFGRMGDGPNERGISALHLRRACEASLRRMQTDHVDLYQMHHVERSTPWDEIWEAMDRLVRDGKVVYVGSSNFAGWDIATACQEARRRGMLGLVSEQSIYNLNNRMVELEVLPACRHYGLAVIPWSPLDRGLLAGILDRPATGRRGAESLAPKIEPMRGKLEPYEALCKEIGLSPATVGLAWVLSNPDVTAPIVGPRTPEQLRGCVKALDVRLERATLDRLDAIFPGPGGEAPKAYAW
jgi:aryl-alcohol dehydrogenase-like predicted oxidoreductase